MNGSRTCQNCHNQFTVIADDLEWYKRFEVPPPTWCPECRFFRRALFRNERKLFRTADALHERPIVSFWPPEDGFQVYMDKDWWDHDLWDPLQYGQDFDPSRPFLRQLFEVYAKIPKMATLAINMVNSEYAGNADGLKNCYLMFNSNHTEDSAYGNGVDYSRDCFDNSHIQKGERCYGSFWLTNCGATHFSVQCEECAGVWLSKNCRSCTDCLGCVNLRSQKYCIFNQQFGPEEYGARLKAMRLDTWSGLQAAAAQAHAFWLRYPNKSIQGVQNTAVTGEYVTHSRNIDNCYLIRESENLKNVQYSQVPSSRDCMDSTIIGSNSQLFYETSVCGWGASNLRFCFDCWDGGNDLEYCISCAGSAANLFGCAGVTKQQYCILNKQYSREEYAVLRDRIVRHMDEMPYVDKLGRVYKYGEFFPPELSPFAYQYTIVPEHFPMTKEQVEAFGAKWAEPNPTEYQTTMAAADIPDAIEDVPDSILREVIQCADCKRAYRFIQPELQFLRQMRIPAPRTCVDCRHYARIAWRNKAKLYPRTCQCARDVSSGDMAYTNTAKHFHGDAPCPNMFKTSYAPDRPDIVYCEQCYNAEVI